MSDQPYNLTPMPTVESVSPADVSARLNRALSDALANLDVSGGELRVPLAEWSGLVEDAAFAAGYLASPAWKPTIELPPVRWSPGIAGERLDSTLDQAREEQLRDAVKQLRDAVVSHDLYGTPEGVELAPIIVALDRLEALV